MSYAITPLAGIAITTPFTPNVNLGTAAAPFGQGQFVQLNDGRRGILGQATTPIPVGTNTCLPTVTIGSTGTVSCSIAATGGTFSYAINLPYDSNTKTFATGIAAAVGDFVWG